MPEIGQIISQYRIVTKIGKGGTGEVYQAADIKLGRDVAIMVLLPERVADASRKARFAQEAKAASVLNHHDIATVHDIDQLDGWILS